MTFHAHEKKKIIYHSGIFYVQVKKIQNLSKPKSCTSKLLYKYKLPVKSRADSRITSSLS